MPPTLLIHGDADKLVPLQQSEIALARLKELKVPTKLVIRPNGGHGFLPSADDYATIAEWIATYLGTSKN